MCCMKIVADGNVCLFIPATSLGDFKFSELLAGGSCQTVKVGGLLAFAAHPPTLSTRNMFLTN